MSKALKFSKKPVLQTTRFLLLLLCFSAMLCTSGCGSSAAVSEETAALQETAETVTTSALKADPGTTGGVLSQGNGNAVQTVGNGEKPLTAVENVKKDGTAEQTASAEKQDETAILTVSGVDGGEISFSSADLEALGSETYTYSMRNKENNNARQFETYTGIPLTTLLTAAGWDGATDTIRISCSDGYNGKYSISEINSLYTFDSETDTSGSSVPAMLAFLSEGDSLGKGNTYSSADGAPLRLVYGQADYDCAEMKDFNTQGWGYYVCRIEIL